MKTETRFDELYNEYKCHAKTARLIEPIAYGNWLVAIETMPGVFLMIPGNATPSEVACQLAIRHVEAEAQKIYMQKVCSVHKHGSEVLQ